MDRGVIDGFLHWVAFITGRIGNFFRDVIDKPIINGLADKLADFMKWLGRVFPPVIQTGRVQQYMIMALVSLAAFSALFYYLLVLTP
jgi:hypothetical protein